MVWLGGVDSGVWIAGLCRLLCGCGCGCGRGPRHSGTLTGGARYRALLGWGLLVACCVAAFRGDSWTYAERALWSAFFARLFNFHEYHVYSAETNTIYLTQLQNLETLQMTFFSLYITMLCKGYLADHVELKKIAATFSKMSPSESTETMERKTCHSFCTLNKIGLLKCEMLDLKIYISTLSTF